MGISPSSILAEHYTKFLSGSRLADIAELVTYYQRFWPGSQEVIKIEKEEKCDTEILVKPKDPKFNYLKLRKSKW